MTDKELEYRLVSDMREIGMPIDEVNLIIRPYSKTFYGNYFPKYDRKGKPRIYIYPWADRKKTEMYPYALLVKNLIHELVHHIQHSNPKWSRLFGVMHDAEFYWLYNYYIYRATILGVIGNVYASQTAS